VTTYWFRPKDYGYGATPATWQGWAITIATMIVVVIVSLLVPTFGQSLWALAALVIDVLTIAALWIISRHKTNDEWRWRWGRD
jgi:hypothetical protein